MIVGRSLLEPHWVPIYWDLFWSGVPFTVTFVEVDDVDGYAAFGYWKITQL